MTKGMCVFRQYSLRLVKEKAGEYNAPKKITGAQDINRVCREVLELHEQPEEKLVCFDLNTKNVVVAIRVVSVGTINASLVHPREVFKGALLSNAHSIVIAHNHPSGETKPSVPDDQITKILQDAGELMQVKLLDHVIVGDEDYYSYREAGKLDEATTTTTTKTSKRR